MYTFLKNEDYPGCKRQAFQCIDFRELICTHLHTFGKLS